MNIRPFKTISYGEFKTIDNEAYYFLKDHTSKGLKVITFGLEEIKFSDNPDRAHIRCVKD